MTVKGQKLSMRNITGAFDTGRGNPGGIQSLWERTEDPICALMDMKEPPSTIRRAGR
jgi:hypothetical protein